jgi:hypothetical protein
MKGPSRSRIFEKLIDRARMERLCSSTGTLQDYVRGTHITGRGKGYENAPDRMKPGKMIEALPAEIREVIKTATDKDFNHRFLK